MIKHKHFSFNPLHTHPKDAYRTLFYHVLASNSLLVDFASEAVSEGDLISVYQPLLTYAKELGYHISIVVLAPLWLSHQQLATNQPLNKDVFKTLPYDKLEVIDDYVGKEVVKKKVVQPSKINWILVLRSAALVFVLLAITNIVLTEMEKANHQQIMQQLQSLALPITEFVVEFDQIDQIEQQQRYFSLLKDRHQQMLDINQDYVGWLKILNTPMDYPFVNGVDNDYYLVHDIHHKRSNYGTVFMDMRNDDLLDQHVVLYGHAIRHQAMFGFLIQYLDQDFAIAHPTIEIVTDQAIYTYEIFSAHIIDATKTVLDVPANNMNIEILAQTYLDQSIVKFNSSISNITQLLTLVSCEYTYEDGRIFVHASLVDITPFQP